MHLSYVGQASCVFHILSCSGLPIGSGCSLMSAKLRDPPPSWVLWRAGIADDCDILVYCYGRKYSMSQLTPGLPPLERKGPEGERACPSRREGPLGKMRSLILRMFCTRSVWMKVKAAHRTQWPWRELFRTVGLTTLSSVQYSRSVMSNSLRSHEPQHARPPCPTPTPGVHPNSCPLSWWCHPTISSSVVSFSSCPQSLPSTIEASISARIKIIQ